jgi:L-lactate dehydrogenase (cytochrome)
MHPLAQLLGRQIAVDIRALPAAARRRSSGRSQLTRCVSVADIRDLARRRVPRAVFDFVDGAAWDELTARRNRLDFGELSLLPQMLAGVADVDLSTTLLGQPVSIPLIGSPTGMAGLMHPAGEPAIAGALHRRGGIYAVSAGASYPVEEVIREAPGSTWLQLYLARDRGVVEAMIARAQACGCTALVVTIDVPRAGPRERDLRNGFTVPPRVTLPTALDAARHPRWLTEVIRNPAVLPTGPAGGAAALADFVNSQFNPAARWEDIEWFRQRWTGPLAVKGILHPKDAETAVQIGADAIMVSNHGGRQLDTAVSAIRALPAVVQAVAGDAEVYLDGGVRRGTDILKAIALGARAVMVGRPMVYGIGAGGRLGAERVVELLVEELRLAMALAGRTSLADVDDSLIGLSTGASTGSWSR